MVGCESSRLLDGKQQQCHGGSHECPRSERARVWRRVAAVPIAAAILDEDVECPGALEAVDPLFFAAQPTAASDETIVITNFLDDLSADAGPLVRQMAEVPHVAVRESKSLVLEGVGAVTVIVRVAFPTLY